MKRYHVIVEGRVQGVGFRGFCMLREFDSLKIIDIE